MASPSVDHRRPTIHFSLWQKLQLVGAYLRMTGTMAYAAGAGLFRGKEYPKAYGRYMLMQTAKALTDNLDVLQIQYNAPTYDQIYREYCTKHALTPDLVQNQDGETIGFWLGSRFAKHTVMHIHGGAFVMEITAEHLAFWHKIQTELAASNIEISIFFPIYTLAPHKTYPVQFDQAVEALRYLIEVEGRKSQDITISGDSAGANLCAAIISHLSHPSKDVAALINSSLSGGKLGGMIQLSPWLSFDTSWPSMKTNGPRDIDTAETLESWSRQYQGDTASDNYIEPVLAPVDWWKNARVEKTLVVVGEDEMFIDGARTWMESFKSAGNDTEWKVAPGEYHIEPFIGRRFGDEKETGVERYIKAWLRERLS